MRRREGIKDAIARADSVIRFNMINLNEKRRIDSATITQVWTHLRNIGLSRAGWLTYRFKLLRGVQRLYNPLLEDFDRIATEIAEELGAKWRGISPSLKARQTPWTWRLGARIATAFAGWSRKIRRTRATKPR